MRLDANEKAALKYALKGFKGESYLFGSRLDETIKGGDIDMLLVSKKRANPLRLSLMIQKRFFLICEEKIDVVIYNGNLFCQEILKNAKKLDITRI